MKILVVFFDMLRSDLTNLYNPSIAENSLDRLVRRIGGTSFKHCITPAPDTPRSTACVWSGRWPKNNGCTTRLRWSRYFLEYSENSLFNNFRANGYEINTFSRSMEVEIGIFPEGYDVNGRHQVSYRLDEFAKNLRVANRSLTFLSIPDYHWAIDDRGANRDSVNYALKRVSGAVDLIDEKLDFESFDTVVIFSDHGFKIDSDFAKQPRHCRLDRGRCNIYLHVKKPGDSSLVFDERLFSSVDIYPTLCEIAGIKPSGPVDGISLFGDKAREFVAAEDHPDFSLDSAYKFDLWTLFNTKGSYYRTLNQGFFESREAFGSYSEEQLDGMLEELTSSFGSLRKEAQVFARYAAEKDSSSRLWQEQNSHYFDGIKRRVTKPAPVTTKNLASRAIRKLGRVLRDV
jgi:hypothetical protein